MLLGMAVPVAASGKDSLEEHMRMPVLLADAGAGHAHPPEKSLDSDTASEHTENEMDKKEKETKEDGEKSPSKEDHETKNNAEEHDKKAKRRDHRRRHGKGRKR